MVMEVSGNKRTIQFYMAPASTTLSNRAMSVIDVYQYITGTNAFNSTHQLRAMDDVKERRTFKCKVFDFVCFSGRFKSRRDDGLTEHSGLLCLDFDHLGENKERIKMLLLQDHLFTTDLLFTSPSGDGLKWVIRIDLNIADHKTWFNGVRNYLLKTYNIDADKSGVNVSRACFLPYDPECYVNPELLNNN